MGMINGVDSSTSFLLSLSAVIKDTISSNKYFDKLVFKLFKHSVASQRLHLR